MLRRLLLAVVAVGAMSPLAVGQMVYSSQILPTRAALSRLGLERAWFAAVPLQPGIEQILNVSLAGGLELQQLQTSGFPREGSFKLTFRDVEIPEIPYNATAEQVQQALETIYLVGPGRVSCSGGPLPKVPVKVRFQGDVMAPNLLKVDASNISGGPGATIYAEPIGTTLFVQTSLAQFHAFDAETGRLLWSVELGRPTGQAQDVAVNARYVFATNASYLYCLDRATGRPVWQQRLESFATSGVAATEEQVMLGLENGKVVAYSLVERESVRFRAQSGPPGGFAWAWSTNGRVTAPPIPTEWVVAFGSSAGKLYAARYEPVEILHRSQDLGSIVGGMATFGTGADSNLIIPSMNGELYSINLFTGDRNWSFSSGAPIAAEPLVGTIRKPRNPDQGEPADAAAPADSAPGTTMPDEEATAFVLNESGILHAVDIQTGQSRWSPNGTPTGSERILAVGKNRVYLQSEFGDLTIVDRASGTLIASQSETRERAGLDLRDYRFAVVNHINDRIYLASQFGSLICVREQGKMLPVLVRDPDEPVFGYIPRNIEGVGTPTATPGFQGNADQAPEASNDFGFGPGF